MHESPVARIYGSFQGEVGLRVLGEVPRVAPDRPAVPLVRWVFVLLVLPTLGQADQEGRDAALPIHTAGALTAAPEQVTWRHRIAACNAPAQQRPLLPLTPFLPRSAFASSAIYSFPPIWNVDRYLLLAPVRARTAISPSASVATRPGLYLNTRVRRFERTNPLIAGPKTRGNLIRDNQALHPGHFKQVPAGRSGWRGVAAYLVSNQELLSGSRSPIRIGLYLPDSTFVMKSNDTSFLDCLADA